MTYQLSSSQSGISPRLAGVSQKVAIFLWGLVTLASLLSLAYSVYSLNLWGRIPAAESPRYFSEMTAEDVQAHADWQASVLQAGFSLSGYALMFTVMRLIGGLSLFLVGFMLIHSYSSHLIAVLMAILLSVFAAAGIWSNPLFAWGVSLAPWLDYPVQLLGWLVWCGAIVFYTFPDGKFNPRWTIWLAILLIPLMFITAFSIDIPLNPDNWPGALYLLPNIFVAAALFAVLSRYRQVGEPDKKKAMRGYVRGISLLVSVYFINLFLLDGYYWIAGRALIQGGHALLTYVLLNEPIWFACEALFAVGLAISVFREKLLEPK